MPTFPARWKVYHLTGALPVQIDQALQVSLLSDESPQHKSNQLFYLTRGSFKRRLLDDLWKAKRATSPKALAQVITSETVIDAMRKELETGGFHYAVAAQHFAKSMDRTLQYLNAAVPRAWFYAVELVCFAAESGAPAAFEARVVLVPPTGPGKPPHDETTFLGLVNLPT